MTEREQALAEHITALIERVGCAYELIEIIHYRSLGIPRDMHEQIQQWNECADEVVESAREFLEETV